MKAINENRLAEKLRAGDTAALGEIIGCYTGYVRVVIRNFSKGAFSEQDIDELCSDVFYSLWRCRENLDVTAIPQEFHKENKQHCVFSDNSLVDPKRNCCRIGFRSYLSAIARNAVKDRFKTMKPQHTNTEDIAELDIPSGYSVEDAAVLSEALRCLDKGLEELPERESEIFARYYFYGESTPEIARKLNISEGTVRSALSRTRNKLKQYLTERGF